MSKRAVKIAKYALLCVLGVMLTLPAIYATWYLENAESDDRFVGLFEGAKAKEWAETALTELKELKLSRADDPAKASGDVTADWVRVLQQEQQERRVADPADEVGRSTALTALLWLYRLSGVMSCVGCVLFGAGLLLLRSVLNEGGKNRFDTRRVTICGMLLAVMLILGWVERQIPTPNGIKLGLSNSVLIFAVYMLDLPTAYVLMIFKVFLSNVLFGNLGITFQLGFAGGVLSLTAMVLISRIKGMHPVTVSIVGGACHNVGQILIVSNTPGMLTILPGLMISGMVFGLLTGVCTDRVMKYMKHVRF